MKAMKCTQCGAPIDAERMICPYCGTKYEKLHDKVFRIERFTNPTSIYKAKVVIPDDIYMKVANDGELTGHIIEGLAHEFMEAVKANMELVIEPDPVRSETQVSARIRLVNPMYRF